MPAGSFVRLKSRLRLYSARAAAAVPVDFFVAVFFTAVFFTGDFLAADFFAVDFFAGAFFAAAFFVTLFFAAGFAAPRVRLVLVARLIGMDGTGAKSMPVPLQCEWSRPLARDGA